MEKFALRAMFAVSILEIFANFDMIVFAFVAFGAIATKIMHTGFGILVARG